MCEFKESEVLAPDACARETSDRQEEEMTVAMSSMSLKEEEAQLKLQRIFVGGISYKATEADLEDLFSEFGEVIHCKIIIDYETGTSKGYGFVTFDSIEAAELAKQRGSMVLLDKEMNISDASRKHYSQRHYNGHPMGMNPYYGMIPPQMQHPGYAYSPYRPQIQAPNFLHGPSNDSSAPNDPMITQQQQGASAGTNIRRPVSYVPTTINNNPMNGFYPMGAADHTSGYQKFTPYSQPYYPSYHATMPYYPNYAPYQLMNSGQIPAHPAPTSNYNNNNYINGGRSFVQPNGIPIKQQFNRQTSKAIFSGNSPLPNNNNNDEGVYNNSYNNNNFHNNNSEVSHPKARKTYEKKSRDNESPIHGSSTIKTHD